MRPGTVVYLDAAGMLEPFTLLRAVVTYDRRLAEAATSLGFPVAVPT